MGYWYWQRLKPSWAVDENTDNMFDLPEDGYLSGIAMQLKTQNEASLASYDDPFPVHRTTISITGNGNFPIVYARGRQLHAMNFWDKGFMPKEGLSEVDGEWQEQYLYIPFGRWLADFDYGLILEKFGTGVQFKDTNNIAIAYYEDGLTTYDIWGLFRKNPEANCFAGGFFMKKQIKNVDAATKSLVDVKIETENKLRQLHIFSEPDQTAGVLAATMFGVVKDIYLSLKTRSEYVLRDFPADQWARYIHDWLGRRAHTQSRIFTVTGGGYHETMIYEKRNSQAQGLQNLARLYVGDSGTDTTRTQRIYDYLHDGSATAGTYALLDTKGICLHGDIPLLMIDPETEKEADYLDVKANKEVYIEVDENSSSGNWYVVTDELQKTYPA